MTHLFTFGTFTGSHQGRELGWLSTKWVSAAVLLYLALERRCSRDSLQAVFWPDADAATAAHRLNQALYTLRRELGNDAVLSSGAQVIASTSVSCDAGELEQLIESRRWGEAVLLYTSPFLAGVHLTATKEFEDWVDSRRARYARLFRTACRALLEQSLAAGDFSAAIEVARRWTEPDPLDDDAQQQLIEALWKSGDRHEALTSYETYRRLLAANSLTPPLRTEELVAHIRAAEDLTHAPPTLAGTSQSAGMSPLVSTGPTDLVADASIGPDPRLRPCVHRGAFAMAVAVLLLLAGGGLNMIAKGDANVEPRRILVFPLENRTRESSLDPVGKIAADWIIQGLALTDFVDVVPSMHAFELLLTEDGQEKSDGFTRVRPLALALGAGTVVVGSYHRRGDDLEFQTQVVDLRSGRLLRAVDKVRGSQTDPMPAIDQLRRRTVGAVGFQFDTRTFPLAQSAVRPPGYEAYQAFAAGMDQHNLMQWRNALPHFRQAFALDTSFTSALFYAAIQHINLRELAQADSMVRILARSRERLPALERQLLAWIEAELRGDHEGALEAVRGLVPFSAAFRNQLAGDALSANRPREAIEAYRGFDIHARPERKWQLNYGGRLTDAYHRLGMHRRELAHAKRIRKRNASLVQPVLWEMRALAALGRVQETQERLEEALSTPHSDWPAGEIMVRAADELRAHGQTSDAHAILLRALEWYRALPDSQAMRLRHRRYYAAALLRADSLVAAEAAFRALAVESPNDPYYIASVAVALAKRGNRREASEIVSSVLNRKSREDFGHQLYQRARVAAQLGQKEDAVTLLRQAFANGFNFAFVGGAGGATAPQPPDGSPHLDPVFDGLHAHRGFQELARGKD